MHNAQNNSHRTPAVAAILNLVRDTGKSAHPQQDERVSELVYAWSTLNGRNPIEVQAEVERYADSLDAGDEPNEPDCATIERGYDPYGRAQ